MKADELIRNTTINRVKSQQAIRRSNSLLRGTKRLIERSKQAPQPSVGNANNTPGELVRQEARKARQYSQRAIEQSRAVRQRQAVLGDKLSSNKS